MNKPSKNKKLAETIRQACMEAALEAYEDAGMRGLCHEGRWEIAIDAIKHLNLDPIIQNTCA